MGASVGQQSSMAPPGHQQQQFDKWGTQFQNAPGGPAFQQQFQQQPAATGGFFGGQSWTSADLSGLLPALRAMLPDGLEARLRSMFQGLSPEQEVNIEAKLLNALEREKMAAVDREDYAQAEHYKKEIEILLSKPAPGQSRANGFARAASFLHPAFGGKGEGKGKGKGRFGGKGKGCGNDEGKGKGKGFESFDEGKGCGRGKGFECDIDGNDNVMGFDNDEGKGKGKGNDFDYDECKGKGKGNDFDYDECKGKGKGFDYFEGEGKGNGNGFDYDEGKGWGKGKGLYDIGEDEGKGCGKGKGFDCDQGQGSMDSFATMKGAGKGNCNFPVSASFARRERAMNIAADHSAGGYGSFWTDGAFAGSFSSRAPYMESGSSFGRQLPMHDMPMENGSSFGRQVPYGQDAASFARGLPCSAARTGQPQLPVGVSFENTTQPPYVNHQGQNTRMTSGSSFSTTVGSNTMPPTGGYTTSRPQGGSFSMQPSPNSFAQNMQTSTQHASNTQRSKPGLEMISELIVQHMH